jgi:hypothetical protein
MDIESIQTTLQQIVPTLNSSLPWALLALAGAAFLALGIGLFDTPALMRMPTFGRVSLGQEISRVRGERTSRQLSALERALIMPLAESFQRRAADSEMAWIERALDLLDYPSPYRSITDFYAQRVLWAVLGFAAGGLIATSLFSAGFAIFALIFPLALGFAGYQVPKWEINGKLKRRREQMLFELPYTLDRLGVATVAERSLGQGLVVTFSAPIGGYLAREFRQVVADYLRAGRLVEALESMARRNSDVELVARAAERLAMAEREGTDVLSAMQVISERARVTVETMIEERGEQNQTLMIAPTLVALFGIVIAVAGPSLVVLIGGFRF